MITLYKRHANGQIGTWTIWATGDMIFMETKRTMDSAGTVHTEVVSQGKQGRTLEEQIAQRIEARVRNKLDGGYKNQIGDLGDTVTNQLELPTPMLAMSNVKSLGASAQIYVQPKLDGMRMIVTKQHGKVVAYSRKGKLIETMGHILGALAPRMENGQFLDGELYQHGLTLQQIMSLVKRFQVGSRGLQYHVFDTIRDAPFSERLRDLAHYPKHGPIVRVDTALLTSATTIDLHMRQARAQGYEGLILRNGAATYEPGKRSPYVVKVKEFMDQEFQVVDWDRSKHGVPILLCRTKDGVPFRVTAPGTHAQRENAAKLVGKFVTVKYAYMTAEGVPFQPICLGERDDV